MTICIDGIIFSLQYNGGISVYFRELLASLASANVPTALLLASPTRSRVLLDNHCISLDNRAARTLERYRHCRLSKAYSVFHSSYYRLPSLRSVPSVVTVHDFIHERYRKGPARWIHSSQKYAAIRSAQAIICVSNSTKDDLMDLVPLSSGQSVYVIHNGVGASFHPIDMPPAPRPFILFVGERRGYKNFRLALSVLRYLPGHDLFCVGGGALRAEELESASRSVKERVHHLGFLSENQLNILYNQAHCLLYPSRYEGFGIPVVEAMRAGCPVVSLNCKAVVEIGGNALERVDNEDPFAIATAIARLADIKYRKSLIKAGLEQSLRFDWRLSHKQTLDIYRSLS